MLVTQVNGPLAAPAAGTSTKVGGMFGFAGFCPASEYSRYGRPIESSPPSCTSGALALVALGFVVLLRANGGFPEVALLEDVILSLNLRRLGRLALLPARIHVSPRRWRHQGLIRQTLRNWCLTLSAACGIASAVAALTSATSEECC